MHRNSTFNLPNLGNANHGLILRTSNPKEANNNIFPGALPRLYGTFGVIADNVPDHGSGVFWSVNQGGSNHGSHWYDTGRDYRFDAARVSSVYNREDNKVIPSGIFCLGIIKY